ncbi:MAG: hypothetical protein WCO00_09715 [Rhodospirillaceae bacterium]
MVVVWREAMSIDGGPIDDDHRYLFSLINEIESLLDGKFAKPEILTALKNSSITRSTISPARRRSRRRPGTPIGNPTLKSIAC